MSESGFEKAGFLCFVFPSNQDNCFASEMFSSNTVLKLFFFFARTGNKDLYFESASTHLFARFRYMIDVALFPLQELFSSRSQSKLGIWFSTKQQATRSVVSKQDSTMSK